MKITVIGLGSLGISLANILSKNGHEILFYTHLQQQIDKIKVTRKDEDYFPNYIFPENYSYTTNLQEALNNSEYVVLAVPSNVIRMVAGQINKCDITPKIFISGIKGIEPNTFDYVNDIIEEEIEKNKIQGIVVLTGPSHAEEMVEDYFTSLVCGSRKIKQAQAVKKLFDNDFIICETSLDVFGLEFAGSAKNAYAIGTGILAGIGQKDNAKAWFIAKAFEEMYLLGDTIGINTKTIRGIAGLGDLIVTSTSSNSRNFQLGYRLGQGEKLDDILNNMTMVAEGVRAIQSLKQLSESESIKLPLVERLYSILYENNDPKTIICND
jgi:glycerol-3-phosphate dehydrogenase (NAD(P)+)